MCHKVDREKSILGPELEKPKLNALKGEGGRVGGVRMDVENVSNSFCDGRLEALDAWHEKPLRLKRTSIRVELW